MGWWVSSDGTGMIGDGPADTLEATLTDALGETFDTELFAGLLGALGATLSRNPGMLLADPSSLRDAVMVAGFDDGEPLRVPVRQAVAPGLLEDRLHAALDAIAMEYRVSSAVRPPRLAEVLETLAFVTRGRIVDADTRQPLNLRGVRVVAVTADTTMPAASFSGALMWGALRALLSSDRARSLEAAALVAAGLADSDWRVRMAALLAVGRLRLIELADEASRVEVPGTDVGLDDDERRALLALRDIAPALAGGHPAGRPVHPDPDIARKRADFADAVAAAINGTAWPSPTHPAYVLRALAEPEAVCATAPPQWRHWLPQD
jgi:hypothetical protein